MSLLSVFTERNNRLTQQLVSAKSTAEPWKISVWTGGLEKSSAVETGGFSVVEYSCTASEFALDMQEHAAQYIGDKNKSPLIFSYSTHVKPSAGGHKDIDCKSITGLILDCDAGGDPKKILEVLRSAGIAHTFSYKPATGKFHVIVQLKEQPIPPGDRRAYAAYHQSLFLFAIRAFSEIAGVTFDPAMAPILMHIDFPACRKTSADPMPIIEGYDGVTVDLEAFCSAAGWTAPPPPRLYTATKVAGLDVAEVSVEELRSYLKTKAHTLTFRGYSEKKMKHGDRLRVALAGVKAPCAPGEARNQVWYRELAGTAGVAVSNRYPKIDGDDLAPMLAEIFSAALERQHEQDARLRLHLSPPDLAAVEDMFRRTIRDIRSRQDRESAEGDKVVAPTKDTLTV